MHEHWCEALAIQHLTQCVRVQKTLLDDLVVEDVALNHTLFTLQHACVVQNLHKVGVDDQVQVSKTWIDPAFQRRQLWRKTTDRGKDGRTGRGVWVPSLAASETVVGTGQTRMTSARIGSKDRGIERREAPRREERI